MSTSSPAFYCEWKLKNELHHSAGFIVKESPASLWIAATQWGNEHDDCVRIPKRAIIKKMLIDLDEIEGV